MGALFLDPGRLDARLALEAPPVTADGQGGVEGGWTAVAVLWGRIEPLSARAEEIGGAAVAVISHRVTIRHRSGVTHGMRFVHRGRRLLIRALSDPDESRRYLICDCEEVIP
ncbi:phage head closure protein [Hoeflea olei]|uniref:Head-tail adaptor protein n=1 Tax=Hoeflea olei TaxID=1480615 RepID=A0A1C1YQW0_9HYPH|nr:phage head closure protein [Hoeflea olei]OCW55767.1 hypothetical protein AWJ14_14885 [Hoeflea olei]